MQLIVTAFSSVRCRVGDIFAAVSPCRVVALCAQQRQKFVPVPGIAHTLVYHAHEFKFPTLAFGRRVVFCVGHSLRLSLLISLEFGKPQFLTDFVVANAQLLNLFVRHMHLPAGFKVYAVDDAVRMNVFAVNVRADQNFAALEISGKPAGRFVCCARVNVRTAWEALHHGRTSRRRPCGAGASY